MATRRRQIGCGLLVVLVLTLLSGAGCSRRHYRIRADRETYRTLRSETACTPWSPPPNYSILPTPDSRLFDPTPLEDPLLPVPSPKLNAFVLPPLPERDPARFRPKPEKPSTGSDLERLPPVAPDRRTPMSPGGSDDRQHDEVNDEPPSPPSAGAKRPIQLTSHQEPTPAQPPEGLPRSGNDEEPSGRADAKARPGEDKDKEASGTAGRTPDKQYGASTGGVRTELAPVPRDVWESLPRSCLRRVLEFESQRKEYEASFGKQPDESLRDTSPRLALEDIVLLALRNSRDYQTRKETLYRVALRVTLQRFDYDLKFAPGGSRSNVDFTHNRNGGITVNNLNVPSRVTTNKMLATGGQFLARFANQVLLTFNGPQGFAADISSDLFFDLSQSVLQRDIQLEALTQAERDLVYAARDFARFRKVFFRDQAARYYNLIRSYRGIEINALDYFANLRAFIQGEAEFRVGRRSRIQVDQVEQNALNARSRLISSCNGLESGLDNLKVAIGLPTEMPLNLDLTELEELTLRDEATVWGELVRRTARSLNQERAEAEPVRATLVNGGLNLIRRMLSLADLRERLGQKTEGRDELLTMLARLRVDEAVLLAEFNRVALERDRKAVPAATPLRVFERTMDLVASLFDLGHLELNLAERLGTESTVLERHRAALEQLAERFEAIRKAWNEAVETRQFDRFPALIGDAEQLLLDADRLITQTDALIGRGGLAPAAEVRRTLEQIDQLLKVSGDSLAQQSLQLAPIEIEMDEAMLTALVRRFDIMNERGTVADVWRSIKLAGDDLRSILDLNATQIVRTQANVNRPFAFTFDESQTRLGLLFDTPLNRKAQRNAFRSSLINYQNALRNLTQLEDQIKLAIRDDLRALELDREQYRIAVASAALAYERVNSTRLQLQQNFVGVTARDFLEAQRAYTVSLNSVAGEHIGYIVDRIDLFLDLEALTVDVEGMWPELYREQQQPTPHYQLPGHAQPAYGRLPRRVWHSQRVRRMYDVPVGRTEIHREADDTPRQ